ncbi:MAG: chemotaxis protein CheW [Ktedonobacteraceae bacterium]|nr:chemotaxis protein CheW [Ktedonobacteraceae bacterium]MBO0793480.1 chemotaxis protein CheW [Ktedonobacteraceae bacterium]
MDELSQYLFVSREHAQFLDALSEEEFWNYAADMARYFPVVPDRLDEYLICNLGKGCCVLPLVAISEVLPAPPRCAALPSMPPWMQGLVMWRENVIAVVDFVAYFSNEAANFQRASSMLLVVRHADIILGLLLPLLEARTNLDMDRLRPIEHYGDRYTPPCNRAIKGVLEGVEEVAGVEGAQELLLLDIPVILTDIVQRIRINVSYDG